MANVYVYSGAAGAATGADWANAYTTLAAACTAKVAGDTFWVAHNHGETQASAMVITSPGTEIAPCRIYCVNSAGSVPPASADFRTTATISTTGANSMTLAGSVFECRGIKFSAGSAAFAASLAVNQTIGRSWKCIDCAFILNNTSPSSRIGAPQTGGPNVLVWENTTVQFGDVGQRINVNGRFIWRNTASAIVGSVPTSLMAANSSAGSIAVEGVDFSAAGAGKTLLLSSSTGPTIAVLKDCKLGASVTVSDNNVNGPGSTEHVLIRCDSGDTNYRTEKYTYTGTQTVETTIVRSGGASDGTTLISWKIVTTAGSFWEFPFECLPISIWNETIGSLVTVTIQGIWDAAAVPNNDEIWIDVGYFGTSGFPISSLVTSSKANGLASGSAIPAGSGSWGGSTTKFAMSASFTPREIGPITIYVRAAKVSSTFYVDPKVVVS